MLYQSLIYTGAILLVIGIILAIITTLTSGYGMEVVTVVFYFLISIAFISLGLLIKPINQKYIYVPVQQIIMENEERVTFIKNEEETDYYEAKFDDFSFEFKIVNNTSKDKLEFKLDKKYGAIFKYFNIKFKDIKLNDEEIIDVNYKSFTEKYMDTIKEE